MMGQYNWMAYSMVLGVRPPGSKIQVLKSLCALVSCIWKLRTIKIKNKIKPCIMGLLEKS